MKLVIGKTFTFIGGCAFVIFALWGFVLSLGIVHRLTGFWGFVIAFVVAPVTFVAAPWYALVAWGNPFPLIVTYGATILSRLVMWFGETICSRA